jgi:Fe-S cluster assembly ATP-binding protein
MLELKNISAYTTKKEKILENININFSENSLSLILGPNAAGKTTFAEILSGSDDIKVEGKIFFENKDISSKELYERAKLGILILYQNPVEIPGVKIFDFLFASYKSIVDKSICVWDFHEIILKNLSQLKLNEEFLQRNINEGFSGGEKKKFEILQMLLFKPKVVVLDEIDSGLDIDSVKNIFTIIKNYQKEQKATIILISHAPEILKHITPDQVLLIQGKTIKQRGDIKLAKKILKHGYKEE